MAFDIVAAQQQASTFFWQMVWIIAIVFAILFISGIVIALGIFIWIKMTYKTKIHYFQVYGNPKTINNEDGSFSVDITGCTISQEKMTTGKSIKKKGVHYFQILRPRTRTPQIPQSMITQDGIYFLMINNDFIPIYKPTTQYKEVGTTTMSDTIIKLYDLNGWIARRKLMIIETEQKYPERDVQIRIFALFIVAMICVVVIFGFMMWLSYKLHNKSVDKADALVNAIQSWGEKQGVVTPN